MARSKVKVSPSITWMCENGAHGTSERRYAPEVAPGSFDFRDMYNGGCAGTVYWSQTRSQTECICECHAS